MPKVKSIESSIRRIERFRVRIRAQDGHDVRGDRELVPSYHYDRAANDDMTVEDWKQNRFRKLFSGFDVDVLNARGRAVPGNTKLRTVRNSYRPSRS
jgi:hypothetical protein